MSSQLTLLNLTLCGPSDVEKELAIARGVIDEWNIRHGETNGFWVKCQHWSTDVYPSLDDRPQGVINRQIIDKADILVAIFWSRFGSPTGKAKAGTEEEIRRGVECGRKVLVYFSDLEPLPAIIDAGQLYRLGQFRQELYQQGLCGSFNSRPQFREKFSNHLALVLNEFKPVPKKSTRRRPANVKQTAKGKNIIQVGGNVEKLTVNQHPPVEKTVLERRPGSLSPEEALQVRKWIESLAEGAVSMTRADAFGMWWGRFYNHFKVEKYEALSSKRMEEVEGWYRQQSAIQKSGRKTQAPDLWRGDCIQAIKAAMTQMGVVKEAYYVDLAQRLKIKPFVSLKALTKKNLERVYHMALRDRRGR